VAGDPWWLLLPPVLPLGGMLLGVAGGRPPVGKSRLWFDGGDIWKSEDKNLN